MSSEKIDSVLLISVFSILAIIGALIFIFTVFIKQRNKLVKEKYENQIMSERQQHALELQALRSQMNPHFVHNSLNAIQYYIQRNEVELSEIYLTKFSKLIRSFFTLSRKRHITIAQEMSLLENYLSIEQLRFEDKLNYSITKDTELDEEDIIPTMLLQPIVENAVNHGIFHKATTGTVAIHFGYVSEDSFKVTIIDDGIGLVKSKAIFDNSGKELNNRSSSVLQDRLKLLEYSNTWKVSYTLEDREDKEGAIATLIFKPIEDEYTSIPSR
jgi:two-component system LytT family sensor kinase